MIIKLLEILDIYNYIRIRVELTDDLYMVYYYSNNKRLLKITIINGGVLLSVDDSLNVFYSMVGLTELLNMYERKDKINSILNSL